MVWLLRRCQSCGTYTLHEDKCPKCNGNVISPHPAKFSMEDKYRKYRLIMKRTAEKEV
ncbi:RNA-protein complex protein Nop10 [Candidatus Bathyarchaeota archaeon]|nr:RNA-protein complex protein Nop10 [Candidatus Bathyarchaeota archaeon]